MGMIHDGTSRIEAVHVRSLAEAAAQSLREAIIAGKLKPGERLIEQKLASQLGIGQPTLREALKELEYQGFVRKLANKGRTFVTKLSTEDIRKIHQVRMVLEVLAVDLAAAHIGEAALAELEEAARRMETAARDLDRMMFHKYDLIFHRTVWKLTGNEYLENALERTTFSLFAFVLLGQEQRDFLASVAQHKEIVEGLRTRDPVRACAAFVQSTSRFWEQYHQVSPQNDK